MSVLEQQSRAVPAGTWAIDPSHSHVEFAVKHLGFATIKGRVVVFSGTLAGGERAALEGVLDLATITTHVADRDAHLRTPDFFDVERHPEGTFVSTVIEPDGDGFRVTADLTLRGITRSVELGGTLTGTAEDPWGNERIGFDLAGTIDRRGWDLGWNMPIPGGGLGVGNDVGLSASFSLVREA